MIKRVLLILCLLLSLCTGLAFAAEKGVTMTVQDSKGNTKTLYNVYTENGVTYGSEKPNGNLDQRQNLNLLLTGDVDKDWQEAGWKSTSHKFDEWGNIQRTANDIAAQAKKVKLLDEVEKKFDEASATAITRLRGPAMSLLLILATISLATNWGLYEGQLRLTFVIETILKVGFFIFLLNYWGTITGDIGNSFKEAGILAAFGDAPAKIEGSGHVLGLGFECVSELWKNISIVDTIVHPIDSIIRVIGLFCVLVGYLLLAFEMLVTKVEWSIFRCLSMLFLPLGVLKFTSGFFQGTLRGMFSYGAKLMVINFLVGMIFNNTMIATTKLGKESSTAETLATGFIFLVLAWIVKSAGGLAQGLVSGSPSLSGQSLKNTLTGLAAGGAGMVIGAAGKASLGPAGVAGSAVAGATTGAPADAILKGAGISMAEFQSVTGTMSSGSGGGGGAFGGIGSTGENKGGAGGKAEKRTENPLPTPKGTPSQQTIAPTQGADNKSSAQQQGNVSDATNPPADAEGATPETGDTQDVQEATTQSGVSATDSINNEGNQPTDEKTDVSKVQGAGESKTETQLEEAERKRREQAVANMSPAAREYLMARSRVFDENGKMRSNVSDAEKVDYLQKYNAYNQQQEQIKAFDESIKQKQAYENSWRGKTDEWKKSDKQSTRIAGYVGGGALAVGGFAGRFAKEMAIQAVVAGADSIMDAAEHGVARRDRFNRYKDGSWRNRSSMAGEVANYFGR